MRYSIAMKWIDALRSGEYMQTKGALRDMNGFCCLGVLCNLHAQAHPEIAAEQQESHKYLGESMSLPLDVIKWAGMQDLNGYGSFDKFPVDRKPTYDVSDKVEQRTAGSMTVLNDEAKWDFKKISTFIRKNYRYL
ncbi:hypothetical protein [Acinetobacter sp.]|uniref:hypothetical protein n=1 Tax=Acinetobacter sp. TaxID=472 RepID=UPI00388DC499